MSRVVGTAVRRAMGDAVSHAIIYAVPDTANRIGDDPLRSVNDVGFAVSDALDTDISLPADGSSSAPAPGPRSTQEGGTS